MSDLADRIARLPPKRLALLVQELQSKLEAVERHERPPIAIIGIGCRFPGAAVDADSFWRLLRDGVDAVREVPPERWDVDAFYDPDPEAPGKMYTRHGAFLERVATVIAPYCLVGWDTGGVDWQAPENWNG